MLNYVHFQTWSWTEGKRICRLRGASLSSEALWNPGCQERWEERRGRGKSQEKVQVTLFFFLETNSGWTQGDARQFTKSQALLSHFSKPCNLETGPQPTTASSSQTALWVFNLCKSGENPKVSAGPFYFFVLFCLKSPCQTLTHENEMSVNNSSCKIKENGIASISALCLFSAAMVVNATPPVKVTRLSQ